MREVADVHRALFPGNEELYGENVRGKIERCLAVTDAEAAAAERERARVPRALRGGAATASTCSSRRPSRSSRRRPTSTSSRSACRRIALTYPFSSLGWPALALPCGPAEDGLPASVQLAGRAGDDARVLAAGRLLESLLAGRS